MEQPACVQHFRGAHQRHRERASASGPTLSHAHETGGQFKRLLQLVEEFGREHLIVPQADPESKEPRLHILPSPAYREQIREVKELLGLDPGLEVFLVDSDFTKSSPDTVSIRTRSLMNIFFYLSQHMDAPKAHKAAGLVTVTRKRDGSEFDWGQTPAENLFHNNQSEQRPDLAFLATP